MPPPQLSTPLPPALFSQGPSHHRSPLTTFIFSLSLYYHHRYQPQYFHSQPRCRFSRLRNYPPFVSFALTDAHHSFWVHNAPSAFPNLTIFYSFFNSSAVSICDPTTLLDLTPNFPALVQHWINSDYFSPTLAHLSKLSEACSYTLHIVNTRLWRLFVALKIKTTTTTTIIIATRRRLKVKFPQSSIQGPNLPALLTQSPLSNCCCHNVDLYPFASVFSHRRRSNLSPPSKEEHSYTTTEESEAPESYTRSIGNPGSRVQQKSHACLASSRAYRARHQYDWTIGANLVSE